MGMSFSGYVQQALAIQAIQQAQQAQAASKPAPSFNPMSVPSMSNPNTAGALDSAASSVLTSLTRGRTSTILNSFGAQGFEEDLKNTSKVILGR